MLATVERRDMFACEVVVRGKIKESSIEIRGHQFVAMIFVLAMMTGCAGVIPMDAPDAAAVHENAAIVMEPSLWMVTVMFLQCPASHSSTEL